MPGSSRPEPLEGCLLHLRIKAALLAALILPASAVAGLAIPPGMEAEVSALVLPRPGDAPLPGAHRLGDVKIEQARIVVALQGPEGEGELFLLPVAGGAAPLATPSFEVQLPPDAPPAFEAAARAFIERLRARDDGSFARRVGALRAALQADPESEVVPEPTREPLLPQWLVVETFFLLAALLLLGDLLRAWRRAPPPGRLLAATGGLFLLALLGRLLLPPWAPLHADRHGVLELGGLAGLWPGEGLARAELYGPAYRRLLAPAAALLQSPDWPLFAAAVAGALSVPALLLLARRLTGSWAVGGVAALGLALHPGHLRLSLSESPWPLALLLFLGGSWALARGLNEGLSLPDRLLRLGGGTLAVAVAVQLRVVTLLLGPLALLLALAACRGPRRPALLRLLAPALLLGGVSLAHLYTLGGHLAEGAERGAGSDLSTVGQMLGQSSELASPLLLLLALLGVLTLLYRRRPLLGLTLLAAPLLLTLPSWKVALTCRTDLIRYQSAPHLFLLLAAAALVLLAPPLRQRAMTLGVGLALVGASLPGLSFTLPADLHDLAFLQVRESVAHLPGALRVVSAPRWSPGRRVQLAFPAYLLEAAGKRVETGEDGALPCFVYLDSGCYGFTREELEAGEPPRLGGEPLRPDCAALPFEAPTRETPLARRHPARFADRDFHRLPARRPWLGLLPCREPR
ncbi:MAG: hypothetical protein P1V51_07055 [Deltaproteobacteria bacterium]|nr:hypothetical protein [Deltaproteobacteria bacterium]